MYYRNKLSVSFILTCYKTVIYYSVEKLYRNADSVDERHRHRYEVNPMYIDAFEKAGMKFVGRSDDNERMEVLELESKLKFT